MLILRSLTAVWALAMVANAARINLASLDKPTADQLKRAMTEKVKKIKDVMYEAYSRQGPNEEQLQMAEQATDELYKEIPQLKNLLRDNLYAIMVDTAMDLVKYKKRKPVTYDKKLEESIKFQRNRGFGPPDDFEVALSKAKHKGLTKDSGISTSTNKFEQMFDQSKIQKTETRGIQRMYIWKSVPIPGVEYVVCTEQRPWRPDGDRFYSDAILRMTQANVDLVYTPDQLTDWSGPGGLPKLFQNVLVPSPVSYKFSEKKTRPEYVGSARVPAKKNAKDGVREVCGTLYKTALKQIKSTSGQKAPADEFWDTVFKAWRDADKAQRLYDADKSAPAGKAPKRRLRA